jgi:hypothetical protein
MFLDLSASPKVNSIARGQFFLGKMVIGMAKVLNLLTRFRSIPLAFAVMLGGSSLSNQTCLGSEPETNRDSSLQVPEASKNPSFRNDVLPVLTKAGCNAGKCHGSASGKDGFRLSLYGYDPDGDYFRLTSEQVGRRINLAEPESSLLLLKAVGAVPHTGGKLIEPGSENYKTLALWIAQGAPADPEGMAVPVGIEVTPKQILMEQKGLRESIKVTAKYSDGSARDITHWAVFFSNNEAAATVSESGLIEGTGPGTAFMLARFDQFTEGSSVIVRPGTPYQFPDRQPVNYIDESVFANWKNLHLLPAETCDDETFLRRSTIDLIGLLPTPEERDRFLKSQDPDKRSKWIDELLERDDFLDLWVMKWAEMLQIRTANGLSSKGLQRYDAWLRKAVHEGRKIDEILAELIPASGGTFQNPSTIYYQTETTPQLLAENIAQAFLGTRIQCAQCHNHPFDRWTMDDYYGFANFFCQVGYKVAKDPREVLVYNTGEGSLKHPVGERDVAPKFLGGEAPNFSKGDDYRIALANWLTSKENKAFSNHLSNVVWAHFMGVGIVEPIDDVRISNPPSNPELLDKLGEKLAEYDFDIKPLIRDICNSATYQLATTSNASNQWDQRHFSKARVRRMFAEVLLDCVNEVTNTEDRFPGLLPGARAIEVADARTTHYFLNTFGRATRNTPCSCEVQTNPTLSQALHLLNGENTTGKIIEGQLIDNMLSSGKSPEDIIRTIYIRCYSREPSQEEKTNLLQRVDQASDKKSELVDIFWAVLNSNEFIFNH